MTDKSLRIVFAGTPDFAAGHLHDLIQKGFKVIATYSQPDRRVGRGKHLQATPVKQVAIANNIQVLQPENLDHEAARLADLAPDVMVVVAFGQILSEEILQIPRFGCINVHASLLPRWRGAAPIERAILAGDSTTGVSIMQMEQGLDTGPVLIQLDTPISDRDNAETLTSRLLSLGQQGLSTVLGDLVTYQANARQQENSLATYAKKLSKDEAFIHWQHSALSIAHQVQAFYPRSPAWCHYQNDRLRIIQAKSLNITNGATAGTIIEKALDNIRVVCGEGILQVETVQFPGKGPTAIKDVFNGHPNLFQCGENLAGNNASERTK